MLDDFPIFRRHLKWFGLYVVLLYVGQLASASFAPSIFSMFFIAAQSMMIALFLYGSYWALLIRRALATPLYRKQSLWVGVIGIFFAGVFLSAGVTNLYATFEPLRAIFQLVRVWNSAFFTSGYGLIFAWIDSSVRVSRKSDPLARDTLGWTRLRVFVWGLVGVWILLFWAFTITVVLGLFNTLPNTLPPLLIQSVFVAALLSILLSAPPALLISGSRSKDPTFLKHLGYFWPVRRFIRFRLVGSQPLRSRPLRSLICTLRSFALLVLQGC